MDLEILLIPGLGFDDRIFSRLDLGKIPKSYLNWIEPEPKESLDDYARRMFRPSERKSTRKILIGYSFGGVISQEISRQFEIDHIILVSSIKSRRENTTFFRMIAKTGAHNLFSKELALKTLPFWAKSPGLKAPEARNLIKSMVSDRSNTYLRWALKELSHRKADNTGNENITQIHGDLDKTFPIHRISAPDHIISGGDHFMVYSRAREITDIIMSIVQPMR